MPGEPVTPRSISRAALIGRMPGAISKMPCDLPRWLRREFGDRHGNMWFPDDKDGIPLTLGFIDGCRVCSAEGFSQYEEDSRYGRNPRIVLRTLEWRCRLCGDHTLEEWAALLSVTVPPPGDPDWTLEAPPGTPFVLPPDPVTWPPIPQPESNLMDTSDTIPMVWVPPPNPLAPAAAPPLAPAPLPPAPLPPANPIAAQRAAMPFGATISDEAGSTFLPADATAIAGCITDPTCWPPSHQWTPAAFTGLPSAATFIAASGVLVRLGGDDPAAFASVFPCDHVHYWAGDNRMVYVPLSCPATLLQAHDFAARLRSALIAAGLAGHVLSPWEMGPVPRPAFGCGTIVASVGFVDPTPPASFTTLDASAPSLASAFGYAELEASYRRELVSVAQLGPDYGWGEDLDILLGGGLSPGLLLAVGASAAGAGKSAFVFQVTDGLAWRTAELVLSGAPGVLTPVFVCSEMSTAQLSTRALGRRLGVDQNVFRSGKSAARVLLRRGAAPDLAAAQRMVDAAYTQAATAMSGMYGMSRQYVRYHRATQSGPELVKTVAALVAAWVAELRAATGREVWPVVLFDPIQRFQDDGKNEVEALNSLIKAIADQSKANGWITLMTSDTTKSGGSNGKK